MGPKSFTIDRLFAIYSSITEESIDDNFWAVSKLVDNLVRTRLFVSIKAKNEPLKNGKFMCVASKDFVFDVAKTLQFDIQNYLMTSN